MIVTVTLILLFLMGFMGIAPDLRHLLMVKTEPQTAVDSCALSAAREFDGQGAAITRAVSAGRSAGNTNRVNMQSSTWSGQGRAAATGFTFREASHAATTSATAACHARCVHTQANANIWLMKAMGAFLGDTAGNPATHSVSARAVATRASAQTACPISVAAKPEAGGTAPNCGFAAGEWVRLFQMQNTAQGGQIGWANLDGSKSASDTEAERNGRRSAKVGDTTGVPASAQNFMTKRATFASYAGIGTKVKGVNSCESITGLRYRWISPIASVTAPLIPVPGISTHEVMRKDPNSAAICF